MAERGNSRAGALLYIGITINLDQRLDAHRRDKPWWSRVARVETLDYPTRGEPEWDERALILLKLPDCNACQISDAERRRRGLPLVGKARRTVVAGNHRRGSAFTYGFLVLDDGGVRILGDAGPGWIVTQDKLSPVMRAEAQARIGSAS